MKVSMLGFVVSMLSVIFYACAKAEKITTADDQIFRASLSNGIGSATGYSEMNFILMPFLADFCGTFITNSFLPSWYMLDDIALSSQSERRNLSLSY